MFANALEMVTRLRGKVTSASTIRPWLRQVGALHDHCKELCAQHTSNFLESVYFCEHQRKKALKQAGNNQLIYDCIFDAHLSEQNILYQRQNNMLD